MSEDTIAHLLAEATRNEFPMDAELVKAIAKALLGLLDENEYLNKSLHKYAQEALDSDACLMDAQHEISTLTSRLALSGRALEQSHQSITELNAAIEVKEGSIVLGELTIAKLKESITELEVHAAALVEFGEAQMLAGEERIAELEALEKLHCQANEALQAHIRELEAALRVALPALESRELGALTRAEIAVRAAIKGKETAE